MFQCMLFEIVFNVVGLKQFIWQKFVKILTQTYQNPILYINNFFLNLFIYYKQ